MSRKSKERGSRSSPVYSGSRWFGRYSSRPLDDSHTKSNYQSRETQSRPTSMEGPTYGTYIYPITLDRDTGSYSTRSSRSCTCNCCLHDCTGYYSNPRPTTSHSEPSRSNVPVEGSSRRRHSSSSSSPRDSYRKSSSAPDENPADRIIVDVVDKTYRGILRHRYGSRFSLSLSATTTTPQLLDFILSESTPSRKEVKATKVGVKWRDGAKEPFDHLVPMAEIARDARQIEIKDTKQVHFRSYA
jgi:hypothetical protein